MCGERGRATESCWGWSEGDAEIAAAAVGSGGDCATVVISEDAGMMKGISDVCAKIGQLLWRGVVEY